MTEKPGDTIRVITADKEYEGILMPDEETDSLIIKRKSGYNVGIDRKKIKKIEVLEQFKEHDTRSGLQLKADPKLPKICILHTGGTIASKVDYKTGGVIAKFSADDMLQMFPELKKIANIETELISNMMSEDMMFSDYVKIIEAIRKHIDKCDGIIIGHGTDTLTYTAAALSFAVENSPVPIILVGSQRSTDRGSSDGAMNLICAANIIAKSDFSGVAICMHSSSSDDKCALLPATKTRKMHTSRRDAFKPINDTTIALVDYNTKKIDFLNSNYLVKDTKRKAIINEKFDGGVGLLKTHPNMKPELFEFYSKTYKALVIEGTGLGHAPTNLGEINLKNYELLKQFIKKGGIVAVTSQCLYGRVHPNVYTNLRRLSDMGCVFCEDMLPETAFIKLSWLLGNYSKEEAKEMLPKNIRGEIGDRTEIQEDFLE